jgi:hypothetical protein
MYERDKEEGKKQAWYNNENHNNSRIDKCYTPQIILANQKYKGMPNAMLNGEVIPSDAVR